MVMLVFPKFGTPQTGIQTQQAFLAAFRAGKDTYDIAEEFKVREAVVYNALIRARNMGFGKQS